MIKYTDCNKKYFLLKIFLEKKTCSFSGNRHVAWNIRLRAAGKNWFTPSIGLHFFMWVIPALTILQLKPILAVLLTGPYLGVLLTNNIHEAPAIWCYTAIAQLLLTYFLLQPKKIHLK